MWIARISIVLLPFIIVSGSHLKVHFPLPSPNVLTHLRFRETIPSLSEFTSCVWVRPYLLEKDSYIFSYTYDKDGKLEYAGLFSRGSNEENVSLAFYIKRRLMYFECPHLNFKVGVWYHICNTWHSSDGHTKAYVYGKEECFFKDRMDEPIPVGEDIRSGGVFFLGDDNIDVPGSSLHGDIAYFNLWDEVLTEEQIIKLPKCDNIRKAGNIISLFKTPIFAKNVSFSETEFCSLQTEYDSIP